MPWISKTKLNTLRRAANKSLVDGGVSEYSQRMTFTGMLLWRLNPAMQKVPGELWANPFEYIHAQDAGDNIIVFVINDGKPLVFEEAKATFPDDALVAKLRLLLQ